MNFCEFSHLIVHWYDGKKVLGFPFDILNDLVACHNSFPSIARAHKKYCDMVLARINVKSVFS